MTRPDTDVIAQLMQLKSKISKTEADYTLAAEHVVIHPDHPSGPALIPLRGFVQRPLRLPVAM